MRHTWWLLLSLSGLSVCRAFLPREVLQGSNDAGGNFLQTFGGIYGVIMAFTIFVVWQQHNDTQVAVEREAVALGELFVVLCWFSDWPHREEVLGRLREYARLVPSLNGRLPTRSEEDEKPHLDAALDAFLALRPSATDERLWSPALDLFKVLNDAREHRITVSRLRLPEGLKWFVFIGGAVAVCTLWLLWVESAVVHALLTAGMTWVIVAASSLVLDLDDPYHGDFVIDWGRFNATAARMESSARPMAASSVAP